MYFRGIAADSKFQEKMKGYLFSEGYLYTGFYGIYLFIFGDGRKVKGSDMAILLWRFIKMSILS